ncbi:MAG: metalloregulator ArsR/SmtB family transcription factor [bacterium]|nr:metalloregulator ArsR/SmtB family transcription factor [bacterium]
MDAETIKKTDFSKEADILKTVGHPVRLKIVAGLLQSECCVSDIWGCLELPQAVVSQHLSILRNKGIISGRREGNRTIYNVTNSFVERLINACMEIKVGK